MAGRGTIAAGFLAALAVSACTGSPPILDGVIGSTQPQPPPPSLINDKQGPSAVGSDASPGPAKPGAARASEVTTGPQTITGFKTTTVILYTSPTSADGQRVPAATMHLPLSARAEAATGKRLEVMTLDGPRWIARSDVVLAEATQR